MSGRREKEKRRSNYVTLGPGAEYDVIWFDRGGARSLGNTRTGAVRPLTERQFAAVLHQLPKRTADELRHADAEYRRIDAAHGRPARERDAQHVFANEPSLDLDDGERS